jgi:hypothetical protein
MRKASSEDKMNAGKARQAAMQLADSYDCSKAAGTFF